MHFLHIALLVLLTLACCLRVCCLAIEGEKRHHTFLSSISKFPKIDLKYAYTSEKVVLPDYTSMYTHSLAMLTLHVNLHVSLVPV